MLQRWMMREMAAQGPDRRDFCTQQLTSRRQGHDRNLPPLTMEP